MLGIFSSFSIARQGLSAQQMGLQVAAQNIANANTEGYSRQQVVLEPTAPQLQAFGPMGTGVKIEEVRGLRDRFLDDRINAERGLFGELETKGNSLAQVEAIFNESNGGGINDRLQELFAAFQGLAADPQSPSERIHLQSQAQSLTDAFNRMGTDLRDLRKDQDQVIGHTLNEINQLTDQIAKLNREIQFVETSGHAANELRDERNRILGDLSELIQVNTAEDSHGQLIVLTGKGKVLVEGANRWQLQGIADEGNSNLLKVGILGADGQLADLTGEVGGGKLKGNLDVRDEVIQGLVDKLDRLAATLVKEVNARHMQGFGLDGSTGNSFFAPLKVTVEGDKGNGGSLSGNVFDPTALTLDDYEVTFDGAAYQVTNLEKGTVVGSFAGPLFSFDGITLTVGGGGQAGDRFTVSTRRGAAEGMKLDEGVAGDARKIAAATDPLPGDNRNALAIAELEDSLVMEESTATFSGFYSALVEEVGVEARNASRSFKLQEGILEQLRNQRESVSGVSLDEEAMNIIRYQRAFQATAQVIKAVDGLLAEILDILR